MIWYMEVHMRFKTPRWYDTSRQYYFLYQDNFQVWDWDLHWKWWDETRQIISTLSICQTYFAWEDSKVFKEFLLISMTVATWVAYYWTQDNNRCNQMQMGDVRWSILQSKDALFELFTICKSSLLMLILFK